MSDSLIFETRSAFRLWLEENNTQTTGVWLLFGKDKGPKTLSANDALEEALCFGWIDGQMKTIDSTVYKKYFSQRRENSKWSDKNKTLVGELEKQGLLTESGKAKIQEAKDNGQWTKAHIPVLSDDDVERVSALLKDYEPAYTHFNAMSPSVKRTYSRAYFDAKTEKGKASRLQWMIDRLNKNLKPM